jgi:hypothetical protein
MISNCKQHPAILRLFHVRQGWRHEGIRRTGLKSHAFLISMEVSGLASRHGHLLPGPCHGSGGLTPVSHREGLDSIPGQTMWNLWCIKQHCNRFLSLATCQYRCNVSNLEESLNNTLNTHPLNRRLGGPQSRGMDILTEGIIRCTRRRSRRESSSVLLVASHSTDRTASIPHSSRETKLNNSSYVDFICLIPKIPILNKPQIATNKLIYVDKTNLSWYPFRRKVTGLQKWINVSSKPGNMSPGDLALFILRQWHVSEQCQGPSRTLAGSDVYPGLHHTNISISMVATVCW